MPPISNPRGTRDFGPADMARRRGVEGTMRETFRRFGFHEVQTPTFEHLELFTAKSGPNIVKELYDFKDKGDRQMALRPELTAPVMRYYHQSLTVEPKPIKLFYFGNCFRYDRPQKGRYREFWQMGCETIGAATAEATAEVLALGLALLQDVGLDHIVARVGHLGILRGALRHVGYNNEAERPALMRAIDKWDEDEIRRQLGAADIGPASIDWFVSLHEAASLEALQSCLVDAPPVPTSGSSEGIDEARAALGRLDEAITATIALGGRSEVIRPDAMIARGLDYYTGIVFEIDAPKLGAEKQLLGGGEYDLAGVFGGESVGTIGFGLGFDRTLVALDAEGTSETERPKLDVYLVPIGDAGRPRMLTLAAELRNQGMSVEVDLMRRNPGKNFKFASARGARFTAILGEKELEAGQIAIKDLTTGNQVEVALEEAAAWLAPQCG